VAEAEETVGVEQAREAVAGGEAKALDVRDEEEWSGAHVPGAIHLPADQLSSALDELDLDSEQRLVVFASDKSAGSEAVSTLREKGFEASLVEGGIEQWSSEDFRLQPTEDPDPEG
jgi:rhodanese-related sulfurtransferase